MQVPMGDVILDKELGKAWLDAAKGGNLDAMKEMLSSEPCLL